MKLVCKNNILGMFSEGVVVVACIDTSRKWYVITLYIIRIELTCNCGDASWSKTQHCEKKR